MPVKGHFKNGKYVSAHTHLNITYLFVADENESVHILEEENSNIAWLTFEELLSSTSEPHMLPIYNKIVEKINNQTF